MRGLIPLLVPLVACGGSVVREPPGERQTSPTPVTTTSAPTSSHRPGTPPTPPTPPTPAPQPQPPTECIAPLATACTTDADCAMVTGGCYCGPTPARGVSKLQAASVQACLEAEAANCAVDCATHSTFRPDRGSAVAPTLANVAVACDRLADGGVCYTHSVP